MGFIFFIIVAGIVVFLITQRQKNVQGEWAHAASRLGLNYSRGGMLNPHWIYGKKAGLRFDIKTFTRSTGGSANQKWTGYRVRFPRLANTRIRVTEAARKRLTSRFQEVEVDEEGIFCARPGIEGGAPALIDNIERLQSVTAKLLATAQEEESEEPVRPPLPPPAAPVETEVAVVVTEDPENDESAQADTASEETVAVEMPPPFDTGEHPEPDEKAEPTQEVDTDPEKSEEEVPEIESPPDLAHEIETPDPAHEIETPPKSLEPAEKPVTLGTVSRDLFDSGRNHFQITRQFDAEYSGLSMLGEGKLLRAEPYSNDRIFGRGPGTLAEVEIDRPEEPLSGHNVIRAVVQLSEEVKPRGLREQLGDTVTISGTMVRCDAFGGRIFLEAGELA